MTYRYDAYCGLYCGACGVCIANQTGNLETAAQKCNMDPVQLICNGCKTNVLAEWCAGCEIRKCAINKNVDYCFECGEFPCPLITEFRHDEHPHHSIIFHNLSFIKKHGIEQWLEEQKTRWSCPECKTASAWYDQACSNCGHKLITCEEEEKTIHDE